MIVKIQCFNSAFYVIFLLQKIIFLRIMSKSAGGEPSSADQEAYIKISCNFPPFCEERKGYCPSRLVPLFFVSWPQTGQVRFPREIQQWRITGEATAPNQPIFPLTSVPTGWGKQNMMIYWTLFLSIGGEKYKSRFFKNWGLNYSKIIFLSEQNI